MIKIHILMYRETCTVMQEAVQSPSVLVCHYYGTRGIVLLNSITLFYTRINILY